MDKRKEIEDWLRTTGHDKKYCIEFQKDVFMGEMFILYNRFNNGSQSFIMITSDIEQIKAYIESR